MTLLAINKDPANAVTAALVLNGFAPSQVTSYTLSSTTPTSIVPSGKAGLELNRDGTQVQRHPVRHFGDNP